MSTFHVHHTIFDRFPQYTVGVVVATEVRNRRQDSEISRFLSHTLDSVSGRRDSQDPRNHPAVAIWREAFLTLGVNPNKYPPSLEALMRRVLKNPELPSVNAVVDLVNALSLQYELPMGAHDLSRLRGDIWVRPALPDDRFLPIGSLEEEPVPLGEIVYATDSWVRTRRWIWRQSEWSKVTEDSTRIFFPIDAWDPATIDAARLAQETLADWLRRHFQADVFLDWVNRDNPSVAFV